MAFLSLYIHVNSENSRGFYFRETSQNFAKVKPPRKGVFTLLFIDVGKSCTSREFLKSQICL